MRIPEPVIGHSPPQDADDCFGPLEVSHSRNAIMDVVAYCADGSEFLVDVSVRNPLTNRYALYACSNLATLLDEANMTRRNAIRSPKAKLSFHVLLNPLGGLATRFCTSLILLLRKSPQRMRSPPLR